MAGAAGTGIPRRQAGTQHTRACPPEAMRVFMPAGMRCSRSPHCWTSAPRAMSWLWVRCSSSNARLLCVSLPLRPTGAACCAALLARHPPAAPAVPQATCTASLGTCSASSSGWGAPAATTRCGSSWGTTSTEVRGTQGACVQGPVCRHSRRAWAWMHGSRAGTSRVPGSIWCSSRRRHSCSAPALPQGPWAWRLWPPCLPSSCATHTASTCCAATTSAARCGRLAAGDGVNATSWPCPPAESGRRLVLRLLNPAAGLRAAAAGASPPNTATACSRRSRCCLASVASASGAPRWRCGRRSCRCSAGPSLRGVAGLAI